MSGDFIKTAVGAAAITASFFVPGGQLVSGALFFAGSTLFSSGINNLLRDKQKGLKENVAATQAPIPIVYGRQKIGLRLADLRVDPDSAERRNLYVTGALCLASENGQGIEDVEEIYFDERLAIDDPTFGDLSPSHFSGVQSYWSDGDHLAYGLHDGSDGQTVDSQLNSVFPSAWPSTSRGEGVAYLTLLMVFDKEVYSTARPNVTAVVKGQKVWDPRLGDRSNNANWAWSDNPFLCALDLLLSDRYGRGASVDEIDEQAWIDAANYADETVNVPNGSGGTETQKRFTCGGTYVTSEGPDQGIQQILSAARSFMIYQGGQYRPVVRKSKTATSYEITEDKMEGKVRIVRGGTSEAPNTARGTFVDPDQRYEPADVVWPEPGTNDFLDSDGGFEADMSVDLPYTNDYYTAQQILMVTLKELRQDAVVEVTVDESAKQLEIGDVVPFSHPFPGWDGKEFWVLAATLNSDNTVDLRLREYDADAYTLDAQSDKPTVPGTELPDPFDTVDPPTGLNLTSDATTQVQAADGRKAPTILATWTKPTDPFLDHVRARYKAVEDADGSSVSRDYDPLPPVDEKEDQRVQTPALKEGWTYQVEVLTVNTLSRTSVWVTQQIIASTDHTPRVEMANGWWDETDGSFNLDARGDDAAAAMYVRVGENSDPADPDGSEDAAHTISGSSGTTDTGEAIDGGSVAHVKVRAEDSAGNLGPVYSFQVPRPAANANVQPVAGLSFGTEDPNLKRYTVSADAGDDSSSPSLQYKWRAQGSPEDTAPGDETSFDHDDDGNDDWTSIADGGTDTIEVTRPLTPRSALLEVVVRDTSIGSAPNHPKDRELLEVPQAAAGDGKGTSVVPVTASNDPGEGTDSNPDGTIYAVYVG